MVGVFTFIGIILYEYISTRKQRRHIGTKRNEYVKDLDERRVYRENKISLENLKIQGLLSDEEYKAKYIKLKNLDYRFL